VVYEILVEAVDKVVEYSRLDDITRASIKDARDPTIVIAFGKAAGPMARAAVERLERVEGGVVVVPEWMEPPRVESLEVLRASHPVPSQASLEAGEAVVEWARKPGDARVLVLVSGGGSALVEKLQDGVELEDLVEATRLLLGSGANIHEVNTVRKHLSLVKGGWLARHASPKRVEGLYASDVPGDRLDSIASGPTVPDPTTYREALEVIERYGLAEAMPPRILRVLEEGARGIRPETPKPGDPVFDNVDNKLIAANIMVLQQLAKWLNTRGYETLILTSRLDGESVETGKILASITLEAATRGLPVKPPAAILAGGETTVRLGGAAGRGGRNQELALAWGASVDKWSYQVEGRRLGILAMDTDGIDGSSPAAGAIVIQGDTLRLRERGIDAWRVLESHDSYTALREIGRIVETGPLPSNLNNVIIIIITVK